MPRAAQSAPCAHAVEDHPAADRDDQPARLRERNELVGHHHAAFGVAPSDQGLDADDRALGQPEHRLVVEVELAVSEGRRRVGLQLALPVDARLHARLEEGVTVLAVGLRRVQREVGVAQQRVGTRVTAGRDADTRRHRGDLATVVELYRLAQHLGQAVREGIETALAGGSFDEHHELVAAEPADRVAFAHRCLQTFADRPQQLVAGGVTEVVVDVLETVDVDEQRAREQPRLARGARDQLFGAVEHERAVGQARQHVVHRLVRELARLLVDQRQRPPAARREHDRQQRRSIRQSSTPPTSSVSA